MQVIITVVILTLPVVAAFHQCSRAPGVQGVAHFHQRQEEADPAAF